MSIILQAVRLREALNAPRIVSLYGDLARRAPQAASLHLPLSTPQRRTAVGAAALCGLVLLVYSVSGMRTGQAPERGAAPPLVADIPMLQSLPPAQTTPTASLPAKTASSPGATAVAAAASATLAAAQRRAVAVFRPPTSLAAPLPTPAATVSPTAWPGRVPPPPGGDALAAGSFVMPDFTPAPKPEPVYQTLADLPQSVRQLLARVRVQVHLYAPLARHRLVMVDGQQLREGEELVAGVRLDEITPRGLVLRHGDMRVKLDTPFVRP